MRAAPTPADVAGYVQPLADGDETDPDVLAAATARLPVVLAFAMEYTRGQGFSEDGSLCSPGLWAAIVGATAREVESLPGRRREEVGGWSELFDGSSGQWSLREMLVLDDYRRRAA